MKKKNIAYILLIKFERLSITTLLTKLTFHKITLFLYYIIFLLQIKNS